MATPLTAFPSDGFTARWQRWNGDGDEVLTLRWENEGWTAMGEVSRERVSYVLRMTATWQVSQFLLFRDQDEPDLWLGTDGSGRWGEVNGAHRPDLDGCTEITLSCSPFPIAVPIRRLQLDVGDSALVRAASVDVDTLGVVPETHRFEHVGAQRWRRSIDERDVTIEIAVDEYGLPHDHPDEFRRR